MSMADFLGKVVILVPLALFMVPLAAGLACALVRLVDAINRFIYPLWAGSQAGGLVRNRIWRESVFIVTVAIFGAPVQIAFAHAFKSDFNLLLIQSMMVAALLLHWRKKAKLRGEI